MKRKRFRTKWLDQSCTSSQRKSQNEILNPIHTAKIGKKNKDFHVCVWWFEKIQDILILPLKYLKTAFFKKKKKFILYWSIANCQCCDSFRWTAKGLSHTYACIHSPPTPLPSRLPHHIGQSSTFYTVGPWWLF